MLHTIEGERDSHIPSHYRFAKVIILPIQTIRLKYRNCPLIIEDVVLGSKSLNSCHLDLLGDKRQ